MRPAARCTDVHICPTTDATKPHTGGPVLPPAASTVLVEDLPQARISDFAACAAASPDVITEGASTVVVEGLFAAREFDHTAHGGTIMSGAKTVIIGGPSFHARSITRIGTLLYYGRSIRVQLDRNYTGFDAQVIAALVRLDSTPTMRRAIDALERTGHTITIVPYKDSTNKFNARTTPREYRRALPPGSVVTTPAGTTFTGVGGGTDSEIGWDPMVNSMGGPPSTVPHGNRPGPTSFSATNSFTASTTRPGSTPAAPCEATAHRSERRGQPQDCLRSHTMPRRPRQRQCCLPLTVRTTRRTGSEMITSRAEQGRRRPENRPSIDPRTIRTSPRTLSRRGRRRRSEDSVMYSFASDVQHNGLAIVIWYSVRNECETPIYIVDVTLDDTPTGLVSQPLTPDILVTARGQVTIELSLRDLDVFTTYAAPPTTFAHRLQPGETRQHTLKLGVPVQTTLPPAYDNAVEISCSTLHFHLGIVVSDPILLVSPVRTNEGFVWCLNTAAWALQRRASASAQLSGIRVLAPPCQP